MYMYVLYVYTCDVQYKARTVDRETCWIQIYSFSDAIGSRKISVKTAFLDTKRFPIAGK